MKYIFDDDRQEVRLRGICEVVEGASSGECGFPESKEFLAGYWIIDVESPEQAYEIAARTPTSAGLWRKPATCPSKCGPFWDTGLTALATVS